MPTEGNHEACPLCPGIAALGADSDKNFTQYKARMHAVSLNSNTGNNRFYSFNRDLTHFVVFSAEAYVYAVDKGFLANQLAFVKADLAAVDRSVTPWVVALVHKDWSMQPDAFASYSPVLEAGGVDVLFCGHVHYYNRFIPYDPMTGAIDTGAVSADGKTYVNPKYMTTIVSGGAGNHEDESVYVKTAESYTGMENCALPRARVVDCATAQRAHFSRCCQTLTHTISARPNPPPSKPYVDGWGVFQAQNATHATWDWHTTVANKGPAGWADSLTIIQTGRGH